MSHRLKKERRLRWLALLLCGAVSVFTLLFLDTPRAQWLNQPPKPRQPRLQFLGPVRPLVRKVWQKVMPRRSRLFTVVLQAEVFVCKNPFTFTNLSPDTLVLSNGGTRVWLVKTNGLPLLGTEVDQATEFTALASTSSQGDGLAVASFHGAPVSPQFLQSSLRGRGDGVEMSLFITSVEMRRLNDSVRPSATNPWVMLTNFAFGAQLFVPAGHAVIMLHDVTTNGYTSGALLHLDGYGPGQQIQSRQILSPKQFKSGKKVDYIL